jgi:tetratricopeptide (TPR) repeat protein
VLQSVCLRPLTVLLCAAAVFDPGVARADAAPAPASDLAASPSVTPASAPTASAPTASAAPAKAANVVEAEHDAAAAFDAYSRGEYREAIRLYEQALAAAPSADILYNIARVEDLGQHDGARAIDFYQRYLAHPSARSPRSDLAKQRILELQAAARQAESEPAAGTASEVSRSVPYAPATVAVPAQTDRSSHAWTTSERVGVGLASAGVLALGVGIGFGVAAYSERDTWRRDCDGDLCRSQRGVDAAHSAARRATVATVALTAGGGLFAAGATLWFLGSKPDENPGLGLHVGTDTGSGDFACALSGRF